MCEWLVLFDDFSFTITDRQSLPRSQYIKKSNKVLSL